MIMNIEDQQKAEKFYIESDIDGIHTPSTNMVEINYLDMVKLMHRYAQQQVENNCDLPVVSGSALNKRDFIIIHNSLIAHKQNVVKNGTAYKRLSTVHKKIKELIGK